MLQQKNVWKDLQEYIGKQAAQDDTWKFWSDFVFVDYVCLYMAIRSSNWKLRIAAIKKMYLLLTKELATAN